jgi:hypothetical protein
MFCCDLRRIILRGEPFFVFLLTPVLFLGGFLWLGLKASLVSGIGLRYCFSTFADKDLGGELLRFLFLYL